VETEPFGDTFGPKAQRKKPRIDAGTFEELSKLGAAATDDAAAAATESGLGVIGGLVHYLMSGAHFDLFNRTLGVISYRAPNTC
jgi:NGP1NT (NUC091) domain